MGIPKLNNYYQIEAVLEERLLAEIQRSMQTQRINRQQFEARWFIDSRAQAAIADKTRYPPLCAYYHLSTISLIEFPHTHKLANTRTGIEANGISRFNHILGNLWLKSFSLGAENMISSSTYSYNDKPATN